QTPAQLAQGFLPGVGFPVDTVDVEQVESHAAGPVFAVMTVAAVLRQQVGGMRRTKVLRQQRLAGQPASRNEENGAGKHRTAKGRGGTFHNGGNPGNGAEKLRNQRLPLVSEDKPGQDSTQRGSTAQDASSCSVAASQDSSVVASWRFSSPCSCSNFASQPLLLSSYRVGSASFCSSSLSLRCSRSSCCSSLRILSRKGFSSSRVRAACWRCSLRSLAPFVAL